MICNRSFHFVFCFLVERFPNLLEMTFEETDLDDCGKVFSVDVIFCLQVQITQLAGSHRVVLGVELVETLEGLSALQKKTKQKQQQTSIWIEVSLTVHAQILFSRYTLNI